MQNIKKLHPSGPRVCCSDCSSVCMAFVFIDANFPHVFSLRCFCIRRYASRQETWKANEKGDNVHQKVLAPFDARCPSFLKPAKARGLFPLSPLFYDVSWAKLRHGAGKKNKKQTLKESNSACCINPWSNADWPCSSGWTVRWLDLLLFSDFAR